MRVDEPFVKPLGMPSWVAPEGNPNMTYGGPSAAHTNVEVGNQQSYGGQQPNVGRRRDPAFNWSGIGPNPNDKPMQQHGGMNQPSDMMNKLPPQLQQFIEMMKGGGQMPQGFMGFNPVDHNPWGGNVNPWGQGDVGQGMYGGGLTY